ncbi:MULTISPECIES: VOC family protein [unclassified Nocardiopsis]|uniref:VOC family protein n=1 Tax=unclassified Nocardiopsis TaxID=2649073 RepID=UPI00066ADFA2|nr:MULTISPECIES: VOC family protein [unclassified Nocardiopsis]MBQ1084137.1 VOC family protein [Nocardiopsis sp. B62]
MITTDYVVGSPCWVELTTADVDRAVDFYGRVFGWTAESAGPDTGGYMLIRHEGALIGGLGPKMSDDQAVTWSLYFNTPDLDMTFQRARELGATPYVEPMDVMGLGRMAVVGDPQGGSVCLWEAGTLPGMERTDEPNTFMWAELWTPSAEGAREFYSGLFGWEFDAFDLGDAGVYSITRPAGLGDDRSFGGIMGVDADNLTATRGAADWHPVFHAADCDAAVAEVTAAGGHVYMGPDSTAGVGRLAAVADPFGAGFVLLSPDPG